MNRSVNEQISRSLCQSLEFLANFETAGSHIVEVNHPYITINFFSSSSIDSKESLHETLITLTFRDLARKGAKLMLRLALEVEINEFIEGHRSKLMPNGCHQIVRNGYHRERTIQTGIGYVSVLSLVFKLVESASRRWQKLHHSNIIPLVLAGMKYQDGVLVDDDKTNENELKAAA